MGSQPSIERIECISTTRNDADRIKVCVYNSDDRLYLNKSHPRFIELHDMLRRNENRKFICASDDICGELSITDIQILPEIVITSTVKGFIDASESLFRVSQYRQQHVYEMILADQQVDILVTFAEKAQLIGGVKYEFTLRRMTRYLVSYYQLVGRPVRIGIESAENAIF